MAQDLSYGDVYLSYSEKGTIGQTFVSHLDRALKQEGVHSFKDDRSLEKGICISKDSFKAIEEAQIIVIVFDDKYSISSHCLDELVKIMVCRKQLKKVVVPIFYDVEPSEVRNQRNNSAFADNENGAVIGRSERVETWKEALREAGNISGWDLRKTNDGNEAECIRQIVEEIVSKLKIKKSGETKVMLTCSRTEAALASPFEGPTLLPHLPIYNTSFFFFFLLTN